MVSSPGRRCPWPWRFSPCEPRTSPPTSPRRSGTDDDGIRLLPPAVRLGAIIGAMLFLEVCPVTPLIAAHGKRGNRPRRCRLTEVAGE
jgi:hypothetical protein